MNLTLISLHIAYSTHSSPFFTLPYSYSSPKNLITFSNLNFNNHLSSLFRTQIKDQTNSKLDFALYSCTMNGFLKQVVFIANYENITLVSTSNSYAKSAASPTISFICKSCYFSNNKIPLEMDDNEMPASTSGAAIYVSLPYDINGTITNSSFVSNEAPFGGAIYFGSSSGDLNITHCIFTGNSCFGQGAHLFIGSHDGLNLMNINFILGSGNTSVYIIAKEGKENLQLNEIRFYQNTGPILVENAADVTFSACCFTKFSGSGNNLKYIPENLISDKETGSKFIINNCCVNYGIATGLTLNPSQIVDEFRKVQEKDEAYCALCRLVPTPSHTMSARVSLACAKEAIIAICCCVFISILGILVVIGMSKSTTLGESVDKSEKSKA